MFFWGKKKKKKKNCFYRSAGIGTAMEHIQGHVNHFSFHFADAGEDVRMQRIGPGWQAVNVRDELV